jgi:dTDP-4-dehydrorhamnose reductase
MMRVAILGGKGMLGRDLVRVLEAADAQPLVLDLPDIDITRPCAEWPGLPAADAMVNCAAFTRVDDAESERAMAMAVNRDGATHAAEYCVAAKLPLIHISTDYVFDGTKGAPYEEKDPPRPLNYYGLTKLEGEQAVVASGAQALVVRTQSLYGIGGRNFVKAILNQIRQGRKNLKVVRDQVSAPTYTMHLAAAILRLLRTGRTGLVHAAASGWCSWWEFAQAIVRETGIEGVDVEPALSKDLKFPAPRPPFSAFDTGLYSSWTGAVMPGWQEGLRAYLAEEPLARDATGA